MRVPPNNRGAEQAVLGALLVCDSEVWPVADERGLMPEHFYVEAHRTLWASALALRAAGQGVDVVTLSSRLHAEDRLDAVGGLGYIASLSNACNTVVNTPYYVQIVLETWSKRAALQQLAETAERLYGADGLDALRELSATAPQLLQAASPAPRTTYDATEAIDAHVETATAVEEGRAPQGWMTGLDSLDELLGARRVTYEDETTGLEGGGLLPGWLVLLAGVNKHGKSSLARQVLLGLLAQGARCLYVTTEMTVGEVTPLLVSQLAEAPLEVVQGYRSTNPNPVAQQREAARILKARAWIRGLGGQLLLDEHGSPTCSQILARAELAHQRAGLDVLIVDHLHHTQPEPHQTRLPLDQVYTNTLKALVDWGRRRQVLVLVAAQATPSSASLHHRPPQRDDVVWCKGASSIAHLMIGVYRPREAGVDGADPQEAWVNVAAARAGLSGTKTLLRFDGPSRAFSDPGEWRPVQPSKAEIIPIDGGRRRHRSTKASGWQ